MALELELTVTGQSFISGQNFCLQTGEKTVKTAPLYVKVINVNGDKTNIEIVVLFCTNDDLKSALLERKYNFIPDMSGSNFIAQAYEHLKNLPDFADSVDC